MKISTDYNTRFLVWFLPVSYLLHIIEEYYGGEGLPAWLSGFLNIDLSNPDFVTINSVAFTAVVVFAVIHSFIKENNLLFLALVTLFFVNGLLHLISSAVSFTYSPGTITGVLIYLPLGLYLFKLLYIKLAERKFYTGVMLGLLLHLLVIIVAWNI